MRIHRRSVLLAALKLPAPDDDKGGGGGPPPPPPPPPAGGPLAGMVKEGEESAADLEKWKPADASHFDQRLLPKDMRDEDPHKAMGKMFTALKGYRDAQARQEKPPEKADAYTYEPDARIKDHFPDLANDAAFNALRTGLHKIGVPQSKFAEATGAILGELVDKGLIQKPVTLEEEAAKLGGSDKAKERALAAKSFVDTAIANKLYPDIDPAVLQSMWTHADGVKIIEAMQKARQETGPGGGGNATGGAVTKDDIAKMRRDPRYRTDSRDYDPKYRKDTDELARKVFGG